MIEKIQALGITPKKVYYNLSYEELFEHETAKPGITGLEKGHLTSTGAVTVDTGRFTGRSAKDKYMVEDETTKKTIWWSTRSNTSGNQPISYEVWNDLKEIVQHQLNEKKLYVNDCFCGANEATRLKIRVISEIGWMSHFVKNMFIRPTEEELKDFEPDWTILHAPKAVDPLWKKHDLHSEVFIAFNLTEKMTVIGGTWYGGEVKKGMFSMMNYFLPKKGIGAFHCSANQGDDGSTAIFFGLSGTGKTTLSADIKRKLIGDDEHGWDDDGVFNFEGGCYAKTINLSKEGELEIWDAIKRDALLENVVIDSEGNIDFADSSKTQNTRVSYPIHHIKNAVQPVSKGTHPKNIIFLTYDAFGVLPPVSKLSKDQAMYQFLSGFTAKVAGTEIGIKGAKAAFSPCFGAPFLTLHPTEYAEILGKKMDEHGSNAYLINTGFTKGPYGEGERFKLEHTRAILDTIHEGSIENAAFDEFPYFHFKIPKSLPNVPDEILNPRNTWEDKDAYDKQLQTLVEMFVNNFKRFEEMDFGKKLAGCLKRN